MKFAYIDVATRATEPLFLEIMLLGEQEVFRFCGCVLQALHPLIIFFDVGHWDFHLNEIFFLVIFPPD